MDYSASFLFVVNDDSNTTHSVLALASSLGIRCEAFSTAKAFLNRFTPSLTGCVLADLRLDEMSGLELQTTLVARGSILPIIFLSAAADLAMAVRAMKNGALTVLEKPFRSEELAEAVRHGLEINGELCEVVARRVEVTRRLETLTVQERHVLEMIIEGTPNKRITRVFGVSQRTVARLRARIYEKMCVESAFELARVIANTGALPTSDGQDPSSIGGREFRTHVSGDCSHGVSPENGGRQTILSPPHFQRDPWCMPSASGKSDRKHPLGPANQ
jgi:two-component system response regulator DctR